LERFRAIDRGVVRPRLQVEAAVLGRGSAVQCKSTPKPGLEALSLVNLREGMLWKRQTLRAITLDGILRTACAGRLRLPRTVAGSTLRVLDGYGIAVSGPLVRRSRLVPGFCPSTRAFARCFLQTPPRGDSPCTLLALHLHQVEWRTFTSKLLSMHSTPLNRSRGRSLRQAARLTQ
jgi:hypothetical protein